MKKPILIIFSVAVLGLIGMYANNNASGTGGLVPSPIPGSSTAQASTPSSSNTSSVSSGTSSSTTYKDGTFTGAAADTPYGIVQIAVVINGGKITDVKFLQMPSDLGHSREVTAYAEPYLKQTTLQAQSANIEFVSGATDSSYGYEQSLQKALDQAVQA